MRRNIGAFFMAIGLYIMSKDDQDYFWDTLTVGETLIKKYGPFSHF